MDTHSFGSIDDKLRQAAALENANTPDILKSAGPVSDAFILGTEPMTLICGPIGSGKTIACCKKALFETTRIVPWYTGAFAGSYAHSIRRYVLTIWRVKYNLLWGTTIPSWKKVFRDEVFPGFSGSSGRPAEHVVEWMDAYGPCQLVARFWAFGEVADEEETRGRETTDTYLNEWDTMPEALTIALGGRVARDPDRTTLGRNGRIYGDCNAPDVLNYVYRDFWEDVQSGYRLYLQPGGLSANAENPRLGRPYYDGIIEKNARRQWYIRRMVHNRPGFTRDSDIVFPAYDDEIHLAPARLCPTPGLRVIVGIDGGNTPAAVYMQETPAGQLRILDCIALETSGMIELSRAMLRLEADRYGAFKPTDFERRGELHDLLAFDTICDPSMGNGEETEEGSDRKRLAKYLKRKVKLARSNDPDRRVEPIREFLRTRTESGQPGLLLDPTCKPLRRGFNQTFAYHRVRGSNERGSIIKNPDSHPCEAACYGSMETGKGREAILTAERNKAMAERARRNTQAGRYNPLSRDRVSEGRAGARVR